MTNEGVEPRQSEMKLVNRRYVEVLKVWYSVFTTLMDARNDGEYTDVELVAKLRIMDRKLRAEVPIDEIKAR